MITTVDRAVERCWDHGRRSFLGGVDLREGEPSLIASRTIDEDTGHLGPENEVFEVAGRVQHVRRSFRSLRGAVIAAQFENGGQFVQVAGATGESTTVQIYGAGGRRAFDIATMTDSKRLLFARSNGTPNPEVQTLGDGGWRQAAAAFAMAPTEGIPIWLELYPSPNSDEAVLVSATDRNELGVALWDGAAFSIPTRLSSTLATIDHQPFSGVWQNTPVQFVTFFADGAYVYSWPLDAGQRSSRQRSDSNVGFVRVAVEPGTSRIGVTTTASGSSPTHFRFVFPWTPVVASQGIAPDAGARTTRLSLATTPLGFAWLPTGNPAVTYASGQTLRLAELAGPTELKDMVLLTNSDASVEWTTLALAAQSQESTIAISLPKTGRSTFTN